MPRRIIAQPGGAVAIESFDLPPLGEDDVRVATLASGISAGTERKVLEDAARGQPCKLGYSAVGRVTAVGDAVTDFKVDDFVFAYGPHATEFQTAATRCYALGDDVDPACGQFLALLGVAYNGMMEARPVLGDTVAVVGLGVVGQLVCQLAKRCGARVVGIDPVAHRRDIAQADVCRAEAADLDADAVIESTGIAAGLNAAIACAGRQARIVCLSWYRGDMADLDLGNDFHFKALRLSVAQFDSVPPDIAHRWTHARRMRAAAALIPQLTLEPLISDRFAFDDAAEAYARLMNPKSETLQIVFDYGMVK